MQFDYEMNQALNGIEGFCDSVYRTLGPGAVGSYDNGISVKENGAPSGHGRPRHFQVPLNISIVALHINKIVALHINKQLGGGY